MSTRAIGKDQGLILVRDFKRPYRIVYAGGHLRYIKVNESSGKPPGRKNLRRGWKQHHAKFPQRGLRFALEVRALNDERREERKKKLAEAK